MSVLLVYFRPKQNRVTKGKLVAHETDLLLSCGETQALGLFSSYASADVGESTVTFLAVEFLQYKSKVRESWLQILTQICVLLASFIRKSEQSWKLIHILILFFEVFLCLQSMFCWFHFYLISSFEESSFLVLYCICTSLDSTDNIWQRGAGKKLVRILKKVVEAALVSLWSHILLSVMCLVLFWGEERGAVSFGTKWRLSCLS